MLSFVFLFFVPVWRPTTLKCNQQKHRTEDHLNSDRLFTGICIEVHLNLDAASYLRKKVINIVLTAHYSESPILQRMSHWTKRPFV